jgi:hypothetical protein
VLNGRSMSRFKRAGEVSAQIRESMRVASGSETGFSETGSGFGAVRMRAMLQALAPRSRTFGKRRLIS